MAHELNIPNGFLTISQSTFGAGTAALAPIQFTLTGAVLETSVDAGDLEADSNGFFYYTQQNPKIVFKLFFWTKFKVKGRIFKINSFYK